MQDVERLWSFRHSGSGQLSKFIVRTLGRIELCHCLPAQSFFGTITLFISVNNCINFSYPLPRPKFRFSIKSRQNQPIWSAPLLRYEISHLNLFFFKLSSLFIINIAKLQSLWNSSVFSCLFFFFYYPVHSPCSLSNSLVSFVKHINNVVQPRVLLLL